MLAFSQHAFCVCKCAGTQPIFPLSGLFGLFLFICFIFVIPLLLFLHFVSSGEPDFACAAGDGHFSPIGGYHEGRDLVLILDTARFKYPPHWVPLRELYLAMGRIDPVTGNPRGSLLILPLPA